MRTAFTLHWSILVTTLTTLFGCATQPMVTKDSFNSSVGEVPAGTPSRATAPIPRWQRSTESAANITSRNSARPDGTMANLSSVDQGQNPTVKTVVHQIGKPKRSLPTRVTSALGNALRIEPKVVPSDDPTRLSTTPRKVGPEVYTSAAKLSEAKGNYPLAEQQYLKALNVAPQDSASMIGLGRLYHRQGRFEQAINIYQRALRTGKNDSVVLNDLGLCYASHGQQQPAIETLMLAVKQKPQSALYRNNLATLLLGANQLDEALQHFSVAQGEAVANYNVGFLLQRKGEAPLARHYLQRALQLNPQLVQAQQLLQQLTDSQGTPRVQYQTQHLAPEFQLRSHDEPVDQPPAVAPVVTSAELTSSATGQTMQRLVYYEDMPNDQLPPTISAVEFGQPGGLEAPLPHILPSGDTPQFLRPMGR